MFKDFRLQSNSCGGNQLMPLSDYELERLIFQYNNFRYIQGDGDDDHDPQGSRAQMDDRIVYCLNYFKPETHPKGICVGAGDGEEVLCFTEKGFECTGVTMSRRNIDEAQKKVWDNFGLWRYAFHEYSS